MDHLDATRYSRSRASIPCCLSLRRISCSLSGCKVARRLPLDSVVARETGHLVHQVGSFARRNWCTHRSVKGRHWSPTFPQSRRRCNAVGATTCAQGVTEHMLPVLAAGDPLFGLRRGSCDTTDDKEKDPHVRGPLLVCSRMGWRETVPSTVFARSSPIVGATCRSGRALELDAPGNVVQNLHLNGNKEIIQSTFRAPTLCLHSERENHRSPCDDVGGAYLLGCAQGRQGSTNSY